jgi:CubicO group peptidase (beta-lactamase class C family)
MFVGLVKSFLDKSYFFSASIYNLVVILVYAVALANIFSSARSYSERPPSGRKMTILGSSGIVLITAVVAVLLAANMDTLNGYRFGMILRQADRMVQREETLEDKIECLRELGQIPSLAVGIVLDDKLVWARGFGDQADLDTIYNIGSITKPIVATAILQLYERSQLDLDGDVNEYLPFVLRHPEYPDTPITIRMLLTHQSGLAHYTPQYHSYFKSDDMLEWVATRQGWEISGTLKDMSFGDFLGGYLTPGGAYYTPAAWSFEPGVGQGYSTPGFDILGNIVEQVSGQPLTEYLQENIYDPLGMSSTGLSVFEMPSRQAVPHERLYGVLAQTNSEGPQWDRRRIGGGGLRSTVPDIAQFLIAHMNDGQSNGYQLLLPETVALMHRQVVHGGGDFMMAGTGMGWSHYTDKPREMWVKMIDLRGMQGHGGAEYGYRASMFFVKDTKGSYGYIMMANVSLLSEELDFAWYLAIDKGIEALLLEEGSARLGPG